MKLKFLPITVFALSVFSCKNETKEDPLKSEPSKVEKEMFLEDSIKTDSTMVNVPQTDRTADKKLLEDFFIKNDKHPQFFTINNLRDTTIICAEKTKITIKANSFVSAQSGNPVSGKIKISVKEYYTISDIILGRLSTTSDGKLLETGGMLNIAATSNQEKCDLKKGKSIEIGFPRKKEKEGMQLFYGKWKNDEMNWTVDKASIDLNKVFTKVDELPEYPGGSKKLYKFVGSNYRTPEEDISGKIYTSFVVNKQGNVTDVKIVKGLSPRADAEAIRVLEKLEKFTPGKVNGIAVNYKYNLPITIQSAEDDDSTSKKRSRFDRVNTPYDEIVKTADNYEADKLSYYSFSSANLGFINCDLFLNYPSSMQINYAIDLEDEKNVSVTIIFHRFKAIMKARLKTKQAFFPNTISRENITIVAIKYLNNQPHLAIKETTTKRKSEKDLVFLPVTQEELKEQIVKLNKFN